MGYQHYQQIRIVGVVRPDSVSYRTEERLIAGHDDRHITNDEVLKAMRHGRSEAC